MSEIKTITIPEAKLPQSRVKYGEWGRGKNKRIGWMESSTYCRDTEKWLTAMSETDIHKNAGQALKELEAAQEALKRAEDRVESLRMFVRELYDTPSLKVVND